VRGKKKHHTHNPPLPVHWLRLTFRFRWTSKYLCEPSPFTAVVTRRQIRCLFVCLQFRLFVASGTPALHCFYRSSSSHAPAYRQHDTTPYAEQCSAQTVRPNISRVHDNINAIRAHQQRRCLVSVSVVSCCTVGKPFSVAYARRPAQSRRHWTTAATNYRRVSRRRTAPPWDRKSFVWRSSAFFSCIM